MLLAFNGSSFGVDDPTFNRDVGFYVFQLPFLRSLQTFLLALLIVTVLAAGFVYLIRLGVRFRAWGDVPWVALRHLSGLISASGPAIARSPAFTAPRRSRRPIQ